MTLSRPHGYRSRPLKTFAPIVLALALLAGCGDPIQQHRPPLDRIFFPTGLAVAPRPGGGGDLLYVVNSNFDLEYEARQGGTLLAIDPEASDAPAGEIAPAHVVGAVRIPSYGGEVAIAHPGLTGCEALGRTTAIVPVRYTNEVLAIDVAADGALSCGEGCRLAAPDDAEDPFGVAVVCRPTANGVRHSAWVTHLSGKPMTGAPAGQGIVSEIDLDTRTVGTFVNLGAAPTSQIVYDPLHGLLLTSPAVGTPGYAPIRSWRPAAVTGAGFEYRTSDVTAFIPSSIVRGLALSTDHTRLYVAADVYDPVAASTTGAIRITGSVLGVFELAFGIAGDVALRPMRVVPVGVGLGNVAVVPRPGERDLVVVADLTGNDVFLFDDQDGAVVTSFGRDPSTGRPVFREPFALASQALPDGAWRVWVSSFRDGTLTAIDLADPARPGLARIGKRIGNSE